MRSFFKIFFASLLALIIFSLILFFVIVGGIKGLADKDKPTVEDKSVLVIDLSKHFPEHETSSALGVLSEEKPPALFDLVRLIRQAETDKNIRGIYLSIDGNGNGYASSNEIRHRFASFKTAKNSSWRLATRFRSKRIL